MPRAPLTLSPLQGMSILGQCSRRVGCLHRMGSSTMFFTVACALHLVMNFLSGGFGFVALNITIFVVRAKHPLGWSNRETYRAARSVVPVTVSFTCCWVDLLWSGVIFSLTSTPNSATGQGVRWLGGYKRVVKSLRPWSDMIVFVFGKCLIVLCDQNCV
jgi:hypothetical protein